MNWGLILAGAHHLAVFTLVALFAAQFALVRPGLDPARIAQLARIDAAYGAVAGLVIAVGLARVWFGGADPWYYLTNPVFWGKMAAFTIMGVLTIPPTLAIRGWMKARQATPDAILRARRFIHLQAGVLVLIPLFAAAMARGYGS